MSKKASVTFTNEEMSFLLSQIGPEESVSDFLYKIISSSLNFKEKVSCDSPQYSKKYVEGEELIYEASDLEMREEFLKVRNSSGDFEKNPDSNRIVLNFQKHYFKRETELFKDPIIREKLLSNREKYLETNRESLTVRELLRGFKISGIFNGYSAHSPFWVKAFISKYGVKSIYDPCGGWGHRLIGSHGIPYIYNDTCKASVEGAKKISQFLGLENKTFYNEDASSFTPKESYDCIFTCPPYYNLEKYEGEKTSISLFPDYNSWLNVWWRKVVKTAPKPETKYFCFIISQKLLNDMKGVCEFEGWKTLEEIPVGKDTKVSHFQRSSSKTTKKGEVLVVMGR